MFGRSNRRGHPLLAGAVIVGASRSATRYEVSAQSQRALDSQHAAERSQRSEDQRVALAIEQSRREEQERDRRTNLAIDEAIARERSRSRGSLPEGMYSQQDDYQLPHNEAPHRVHSQGPPPAYLSSNSTMGGVEPQREIGGRYCISCGCAHKKDDRFCAGCGCKLPTICDQHEFVGDFTSGGSGSAMESKQ